jgi:hypothetical protein
LVLGKQSGERHFRIALEPLAANRHVLPEAAVTIDAKVDSGVVIPLHHDRRPVPRIRAGRDPRLAGEGLASDQRAAAGRAYQLAVRFVQHHAIAPHTLLQAAVTTHLVAVVARRIPGDRAAIGLVQTLKRPVSQQTVSLRHRSRVTKPARQRDDPADDNPPPHRELAHPGFYQTGFASSKLNLHMAYSV